MSPDMKKGTEDVTKPLLTVDRVACTGHGVCATVLPEHITLDEWGYPILDGPIPESVEARLAVKYCPARALYWQYPSVSA
ncbi:ferredoxin [Arthrobacter sp. B1805]|uniref:ferredoxin n=1 Tax=Arthrobacter sp. B1805 TaxID=2058892 RepID=UPI000CE3D918|nr:ferredoxin [Arthrobacter sp. B1805]